MPLPVGPTLTKLKIQADRAERVYNETEREANALIYKFRREYQEKWLAYVERGRELGYCVELRSEGKGHA